MDWILFGLLFLHVGGAILAFGPTFTFPIIGAMGGKEPAHVNFALRVQNRIAQRLVVPLALLQGVTGLLLLLRLGLELLTKGWLLLGIALYLINLGISLGLSLPNLRRLIEATASPPPAPAPGAPAPTGPPPHIRAMVLRAQRLGMITAALIVVIVFLMVTKPF
jgi:uncharacterized membrane protein